MIKHAIFCAKELKATLEKANNEELKANGELTKLINELVNLIGIKFGFKKVGGGFKL